MKIGVYFTADEVAFIRSQPEGFVRALVREAMAAHVAEPPPPRTPERSACPRCGAPLWTPQARNCLNCKAKW